MPGAMVRFREETMELCEITPGQAMVRIDPSDAQTLHRACTIAADTVCTAPNDAQRRHLETLASLFHCIARLTHGSACLPDELRNTILEQFLQLDR